MRDSRNWTLFFLFRTLVIRPTLKLLYRFSIEGLENVPKTGPAILVCKHQSWVDLFAVSEILTHRQMIYVAKRELFENLFGDFNGSILRKIGSIIVPFTAGSLRKMGAIPIDRQHPERIISSFKEIKKLITGDEFLVFYPEGETVPGRMGEFKTGLINLLVRMQKKADPPACFLPVGISYGNGADMPIKLELRIGSPLRFNGTETDAAEILKGKIEELTNFSL